MTQAVSLLLSVVEGKRKFRGKEKPQRRTAVSTSMLEDIRFERHFRTPYSEGYYIMEDGGLQNNGRLGTIDIHFTTTVVHGTLILERELEEAELTKLIEQIDEDIVLSADMPRDDFLVSVYVGKDIGFYSDEYFADENNEGEGYTE
ncbi:hypothetical protein EI42_02558 [Thermosporothrix hazakensis]|jgi:hypothetical protein|uniref:Uncharacterized protein n=2 Tax=Thermosporothrix TaxID=768650 RepID=A0A326U8R8_THEHA|nr:hypothetical protein [Thermosporothrix hazakensis]PZW30586.1 hypothetical protein EI42_02558 [Thermosporothrix hazakensis]BBH91301.1 hypothetical protein KTC_60520 [Thermosporothrix sp. COM3]GCE49448.1 hypothetical protein KTH_43170 [Thermosporothrix hazakensis]